MLSPRAALEDLGGAIESSTSSAELAHAARQVSVLATAQAAQALAAGGVDADQRAATVVGVGRAVDEAPPSSSRRTRVAVGRLTRSISASSLA